MIHYKNQHVTVFQSALFQTTSTVVETNDLVLVVDPTWLPGEVDAIKHHVDRVRKNRPVYLLFTHSDWDHIIGYRAFPGAITIGSHLISENPDKEQPLNQILDFDAKNYILRDYPIEYPTLDHAITVDGQQLTVGSTTLTFYLAGGHTPDGLFTYVEPAGVFLAGDYLSDCEPPFVYDSSAAYVATMGKVEHIVTTHDVRLMVPGHGSAATEKTEILRRVQESLDYIRNLKQAIADENQAAADSLLDPYVFARCLKRAHQDNINQFKREAGLADAK